MIRVKVAYLGDSSIEVVMGMCMLADYDHKVGKHYIDIHDVRTNMLHRVYMASIIKWEDVPDPQ